MDSIKSMQRVKKKIMWPGLIFTLSQLSHSIQTTELTSTQEKRN